MSWNEQWPNRDPTAFDGVGWQRGGLEPMPTADIVEHRHTCPDGTVLVCFSQRIHVTGVTLDRWKVGSYLIATSARANANTEPPDFDWADRRAELRA